MAIKVLLIDDDQDILDVLIYVLEEEGYEVVCSTSADILQRIGQISPDIILLDEWLCEEEKGSEHCRKLKADLTTRHIPVLMISAFMPIEEVVAEAGADGFIKKPFDIDELKPAIQKALKMA